VVYQADGGGETRKTGFFMPAMNPEAPAGNDMVTALSALKHCPLPPEMSCRPAIEKPR
jgi:hypothetical protein